jgi:hypothetical protein
MFEFLGRGKNKTANAESDPGPSTMPQTVQLGPTQLEMVRLTLHSVLKLNGIPGTWISGEVIPINIPGQGEALLLQLKVNYWHDALVLHATALERALLEGLRSFDPLADPTRYIISWKFSSRSGCPYIHLPLPVFWQTSDRWLMTPVAAPAVTTVPVVATVPTATMEPPAPPLQTQVQQPAVTHPEEDVDDDGFAPTHIRDDS